MAEPHPIKGRQGSEGGPGGITLTIPILGVSIPKIDKAVGCRHHDTTECLAGPSFPALRTVVPGL